MKSASYYMDRGAFAESEKNAKKKLKTINIFLNYVAKVLDTT